MFKTPRRESRCVFQSCYNVIIFCLKFDRSDPKIHPLTLHVVNPVHVFGHESRTILLNKKTKVVMNGYGICGCGSDFMILILYFTGENRY